MAQQAAAQKINHVFNESADDISRAEPVIDLVHLSRQTLGDTALETELLRLFEGQARAFAARLRAPAPQAETAGHPATHRARAYTQGLVARDRRLRARRRGASLRGSAKRQHPRRLAPPTARRAGERPEGNIALVVRARSTKTKQGRSLRAARGRREARPRCSRTIKQGRLLVRTAGSQPALPCEKQIFLPLRLSPPPLNGAFVVWTIPSPWRCRFRRPPSSLYTFPGRSASGLARDWLGRVAFWARRL